MIKGNIPVLLFLFRLRMCSRPTPTCCLTADTALGEKRLEAPSLWHCYCQVFWSKIMADSAERHQRIQNIGDFQKKY